MAAVLVLSLSGCGGTFGEEKGEVVESGGRIYEYRDNAGEIAKTMKNPMRDDRTGFMFDCPDGFSAETEDEYILLTSDKYPDGSILLYMDSEFDSTGGYPTFLAYSLLSQRAPFKANGRMLNPSLVSSDTGEVTEVKAGDRDAVAASAELFASGETRTFETVFYGTAVEGKPFAAQVTGSGDIKPLEDAALEILATAQRVKYAGDPVTNHPEETLAFRTLDLGSASISVPYAWRKTTLGENLCVLIPPAADGTGMDHTRIIFYMDRDGSIDPEYGYDMTGIYYNSDVYPAVAAAMSPYIRTDTGRGFVAYPSKPEDKTVNGIEVFCRDFSTVLTQKRVGGLSSLPDISRGTKHYAFQTDDGVLNMIVSYKSPTEEEAAQKLAEAMLSTVR